MQLLRDAPLSLLSFLPTLFCIFYNGLPQLLEMSETDAAEWACDLPCLVPRTLHDHFLSSGLLVTCASDLDKGILDSPFSLMIRP
jgi:hypothetical protein